MAAIRINAPLPLDVASTLIRAVGALYPGATVGTPGDGEALVLEIPDSDRGIDDAVLAEITALKESAEAATADFDILHADGSDMRTTAAAWLAQVLIPAARAFLHATGAENYVEQEVRLDVEGSGGGYVFSVARSPEQTPHALRLKAERELAELRTAVQAAHIPDKVKKTILGD